MNNDVIGVVGGMGPFAGLDLARKIFAHTKALSDQEHFSIALLSYPKLIEDRTSFLLGETSTNPADAIFSIIERLEYVGARVVGIPCHTAHSPQILGIIVKKLKKAGSQIKLIHMLDEVRMYILENHPQINDIGLLSTTGTYRSKIYEHLFKDNGINVILANDIVQDFVHNAIYDPEYGIKARSFPVTKTARSKLMEGIEYLQEQGAKAIILGCTEISYALTSENIGKSIMIDPTQILARALIREIDESKLKL